MLDDQVKMVIERASMLVKEGLSFFVTTEDNDLYYKKFSELMIFIDVTEDAELRKMTHDFKCDPMVMNVFSVSKPTNSEIEFILASNKILKLLSTKELYLKIRNYNCSYLKPFEHLQINWLRKINGIKVDNKDIERMLQCSSACIQKSLINYDYSDLYQVTHAVFFTSNFGREDLGDFLNLKQLTIMKNNIFIDLCFSLKAEHGDLAGELFLCLIYLKKYLNLEEQRLLLRLLNMYLTHEAIPFLENLNDIKKDKTVYHYVLVLGMMGKAYEKYFCT